MAFKLLLTIVLFVSIWDVEGSDQPMPRLKPSSVPEQRRQRIVELRSQSSQGLPDSEMNDSSWTFPVQSLQIDHPRTARRRGTTLKRKHKKSIKFKSRLHRIERRIQQMVNSTLASAGMRQACNVPVNAKNVGVGVRFQELELIDQKNDALELESSQIKTEVNSSHIIEAQLTRQSAETIVSDYVALAPKIVHHNKELSSERIIYLSVIGSLTLVLCLALIVWRKKSVRNTKRQYRARETFKSSIFEDESKKIESQHRPEPSASVSRFGL